MFELFIWSDAFCAKMLLVKNEQITFFLICYFDLSIFDTPLK